MFYFINNKDEQSVVDSEVYLIKTKTESIFGELIIYNDDWILRLHKNISYIRSQQMSVIMKFINLAKEKRMSVSLLDSSRLDDTAHIQFA
jgi:hypothetical protein